MKTEVAQTRMQTVSALCSVLSVVALIWIATQLAPLSRIVDVEKRTTRIETNILEWRGEDKIANRVLRDKLDALRERATSVEARAGRLERRK